MFFRGRGSRKLTVMYIFIFFSFEIVIAFFNPILFHKIIKSQSQL